MGIIQGTGTEFNQTEESLTSQMLSELKKNNNELITANILSRLNTTLRHPNYIPSIADVVPSTSTLQNPFDVFDAVIGGTYGSRLSGVSLAVDSVFQTNYHWQLQVDGITNPNPSFMPFDPTVNTFDLVPQGEFYLVKPGSGIHIKSYNHNTSNTTDGVISIYIAIDMLNQEESNALFNKS